MKLSISIIGAGGLAVTAAWRLAEVLDSEYQIKIFDHDSIELSNLNRQILFSINDIGKNKSQILVERLKTKFPNANLVALPYSINKDNIDSELKDSFAIIDATDSARTSFLLNDYCANNLKIFSYAGVMGRYGQAILVNPTHNSPCLRCIFGDWQEQDYEEIETTCQAAGILGPVAGYFGYIQAQSVIEAISANTSHRNELIKFSLSDLESTKIKTETSVLCKNNCANKKISKMNLSEKDCPQTFILSKLALEQASANNKILLSFKTKENALKTAHSIISEGKVANWVGIEEKKHLVITCN